MRSLICGAAFILASASAVLADDQTTAPDAATPPVTTTAPATAPDATTTTTGDPMANAYGNTIVATINSYETHTRYAADHTFTGIAPAVNYTYQGTWELTPDGKVCRTFNPEPPGVTNPDCDAAPLGVHAVGDVWKDAAGNDVSLLAGVQ